MYNSLEKFYELVSIKGETNKWDYKKDIHLNPNSAFADVLKDILAFGNSGGGWLVLGVDDNGKIVGVEKKIDITSISDKIQNVLGTQIQCLLNYYEIEEKEKNITVGLLYIYEFERIITSTNNLSNSKNKPIVQQDIVYVRRNSSSTKADGEDLTKLFLKISQKGTYKYRAGDMEILERNRNFYLQVSKIDDYLKCQFKFNAISFADKLNYIYSTNQSEYSRLELGILLGLDIEYLDEYFEGKRLPRLEHILRAIEIFRLPHDYFF